MRQAPVDEERIREIVREELGRLLPELLGVDKVAERLSISRWQVYKLLDQQVLASVYVGRRRLVRAESLRAYVAGLPEWR